MPKPKLPLTWRNLWNQFGKLSGRRGQCDVRRRGDELWPEALGRFRCQVVAMEVGMRHCEALWVGMEAYVKATVWSAWSWELDVAVIA